MQQRRPWLRQKIIAANMVALLIAPHIRAPTLHSRYDASVPCPRSKPNYPPTRNGEGSASLAATKSAASARASGLRSTATLTWWTYCAKRSAGRIPKLLPIKFARMAASPFGFYRGAVPVMAADLAKLPNTGIHSQICGDAHVRNLGAFAGVDGRLIFDINDFDETIRGPWEWDVKRMAASLMLAGPRSQQHREGVQGGGARFRAQLSRVDAPILRDDGA